MTDPGELEPRLRWLEQRLPSQDDAIGAANADAAAARLLAGGADRDVAEVRAELRAHTSALNALRAGQRDLEVGQREMEARVDSLEREMRAGFATVSAGVSQILSLLAEDTRPQPG